jgi:hypothetical protein
VRYGKVALVALFVAAMLLFVMYMAVVGHRAGMF